MPGASSLTFWSAAFVSLIFEHECSAPPFAAPSSAALYGQHAGRSPAGEGLSLDRLGQPEFLAEVQHERFTVVEADILDAVPLTKAM
jgi:hypothetical protein